MYIEQFTSPIGKSDLTKIKNATKGEFKLAKRWLVEDGSEILKMQKKESGFISIWRSLHRYNSYRITNKSN